VSNLRGYGFYTRGGGFLMSANWKQRAIHWFMKDLRWLKSLFSVLRSNALHLYFIRHFQSHFGFFFLKGWHAESVCCPYATCEDAVYLLNTLISYWQDFRVVPDFGIDISCLHMSYPVNQSIANR
jgi:hypothetical protein